MSNKQLLFYELVTPISKSRHETWSVTEDVNYSFASEVNAVPLMTVEFTAAAREYPIVFSVEGGTAVPVAVVGVDQGRSLFVKTDGAWNAAYVPAFVRRYPFVFSASEDGQTLTLCIDEAYEGLDRKGRQGQRLFGEEGERTAYLERVLAFMNAFQEEHARTKLFGSLLVEHDLLESSEANITLPDGSKRQLNGFSCVSREKLKALDADALKSLAGNDALELIYVHLNSMKSFDEILRRLQPAPDGNPPELQAA